MKTLGVIIGTTDEPVSKGYYKKNKAKLSILKEYGYDLDYIPYDAALFAEIHSQGSQKGIEVIPLFGQELTLQECNQCDSIFTIYEGVYSFFDGGYPLYNKFMNTLKKTSAKVYPSQKMQEFIIKKHKYMDYLDKKGYPIAPTKYIDVAKYNTKTLMNFINKHELQDIIVKPELGAFKRGLKIIKKPTESKVKKQIETLKKQGFKRLLLQPYLEEFNKYGEIKTYWINGENIYSYNQKWKDGEGVFTDESTIEPELLQECLKTGEQLYKDLSKDHEKLLQCRIDFACCINNDERCREFFINEIEISPTIGEQESGGTAFKKLAETIITTL
jgi:glutathione synthase/RimK-type ligase-like ATP-grasp enzyme